MVTNNYLLNTPTDRSGLVVVFAAVGVCWTLTVLVARLAGSVSRRRALGWEDGGIIASTVSIDRLPEPTSLADSALQGREHRILRRGLHCRQAWLRSS